MATISGLLPEVQAFLLQDPIPMFIGGQWVEAADGGVLQTIDPGDGCRWRRWPRARRKTSTGR